MIYSVTVKTYIGDSLELELANPWKTGIAIQEIKGLGPAKADINVTDFSTSDGSMFNSARLQKRNIVFTFRILGNPSIENSRLMVYKYFPIKKKITLTFKTDNRLVETEGYVESCTPNIFNKEQTISVSIICPDPYFYSILKNITYFHGEEPSFEFAFDNDNLTEPVIETGIIKQSSYRNIFYEGDDEIGMKLTIHALGPIKNLVIYKIDTNERMFINDEKLEAITGSGLINGDSLVIDTSNGHKSVTLIRDGISINVLNILDKNPSWFKLRKGDNIFAYSVDEGNNYLHFSVENKVIYEGI